MPETTLQLLMVASEAAPFAKTGGLADVVGSLPPALRALGHDVRLVLPYYRTVRESTGELPVEGSPLDVAVGERRYKVVCRHGEAGGVPVTFIDQPEFFDRQGLYGEQGRDYQDNAERFALLCAAALDFARRLKFAPDVIHAHDWQTGLVPVFLLRQADPLFADTASLFTIHNLGYQGLFPLDVGRVLGLDPALLGPDGLEYHGRLSLLKGGIRFADQVNTVSPTYCREIQTPELGMGMDGLLRSRADRLHGLLNGLDGSLWSPADDRELTQNFAPGRLDGKAACKRELQTSLGLKVSARTPLVAMVTRLDPQKGIDLVLECWDRIMDRDLQLVVLGTGTPDFEQRLSAAASYYPGQACVLPYFDDALSRRIYAGSDMFLMPSRYEPCGLSQLIALRYGSVPLVHATGGLADTIDDPADTPDSANGFSFAEFAHEALLAGLDRALSAYISPQVWQKMIVRGMTQDFSWSKVARQYTELYRRCLAGRHMLRRGSV